MAEFTKPNPDRPFSVPNYIWILIAILAVLAYFVGLDLPLVGPDEPRYAQVAREMFERGDWVTPTLGGHTWFEKPALLYWMETAAYRVFGVNEFAARLGPALCGLGTAASLWILGRFTDPNGLANWLGVVALSTLGIIVFSHGASFDILITFTLTGALVSFYIFDRTGKRAALASFYAFVGLSLLAKGLIGVVFPFGIVSLYYLASRRWPQRAFLYSLVWGTMLTGLIASTWYLPAYIRNGWPFINEFIVQHHFQRFASNKYQHPQPFYFYLWVLPLMVLPWLPFCGAGAVSLGKTERDGKAGHTETSSLHIFALIWIAVPLVFFSLSGSKLPGYILPSVPGAIILASLWISRSTPRWQKVSLGIAGVVLAAIVVLLFTIVPRFANAESVKPLISAANERGLTSERVFAVHCVPHGAEFYAAGDRLLRDPAGAQKKLYSGPELKFEMERAGVTRALVLIPKNYPDDVTGSKSFTNEFLGESGELAIYLVELR
jgi:4-amino-4-deoxy-L-arabinose transferase-like glycosyltransferase